MDKTRTEKESNQPDVGSGMTFTDDDLKRLKAKEGYWKTTVKMNEGQSESWGFVDGDKIDALLARLEAAEKALIEFAADDSTANESFLLWRKSKGHPYIEDSKAAGK